MVTVLPHKDLVNLPKDFTLVINTSNPKNHIYSYEILDWMHNSGICLLLNRTAYNLKSMLDNIGFNTNKLYFIDAVSKSIDSKFNLDKTDYLHSYKNLNLILSSIERLSAIPGNRFIIIDSLNHLLMHHDKKTAMSFLDFLNKRLKLLNLNSIYLADFNKLNNEVKNKLSKMSDRIINL